MTQNELTRISYTAVVDRLRRWLDNQPFTIGTDGLPDTNPVYDACIVLSALIDERWPGHPYAHVPIDYCVVRALPADIPPPPPLLIRSILRVQKMFTG